MIRKNVGKDGWASALVAGLGACLIVAVACAGGDTPPRDGDLEDKIRTLYDPDFQIGGAGSASLPAGGSGGGGGQGGGSAGGAGGGSSGTGGASGGGSGGGAGSAAGSGSSGTSSGGAVCDAPGTVLIYNCGLGSGCHGAEARLGDFGVSEAAARALVDKPTQTSPCKYIDTANIEKSAILDKLLDTRQCGGGQMPFMVDPLPQADIDCVRSWLSQF